MKMYVIEKNTTITAANTRTLRTFSMKTTKRNEFFDTVLDPVSYANGRRNDELIIGRFNASFLAENEHYIFAEGEWVMAVATKYVKTLA